MFMHLYQYLYAFLMIVCDFMNPEGSLLKTCSEHPECSERAEQRSRILEHRSGTPQPEAVLKATVLMPIKVCNGYFASL